MVEGHHAKALEQRDLRSESHLTMDGIFRCYLWFCSLGTSVRTITDSVQDKYRPNV